MQTDDLVLECLLFIKANPGRKHYVATARRETAEVLDAILNPYMGSGMFEIGNIAWMSTGWHDDNANVALCCTHAFGERHVDNYEQLRWRLRHPDAKVFVQMKPVEDQDSLLFRVRDYGVDSFVSKKDAVRFLAPDEIEPWLAAKSRPGKWFKSKTGTELFCLAKPYSYT